MNTHPAITRSDSASSFGKAAVELQLADVDDWCLINAIQSRPPAVKTLETNNTLDTCVREEWYTPEVSMRAANGEIDTCIHPRVHMRCLRRRHGMMEVSLDIDQKRKSSPRSKLKTH